MVSIFDREARIDEASELIETNLTLLGCVAIEDKLQVCEVVQSVSVFSPSQDFNSRYG